MNLPNGRGFCCYWILIQKGPQVLPLNAVLQDLLKLSNPDIMLIQGRRLPSASKLGRLDWTREL